MHIVSQTTETSSCSSNPSEIHLVLSWFILIYASPTFLPWSLLFSWTPMPRNNGPRPCRITSISGVGGQCPGFIHAWEEYGPSWFLIQVHLQRSLGKSMSRSGLDEQTSLSESQIVDYFANLASSICSSASLDPHLILYLHAYTYTSIHTYLHIYIHILIQHT